MADISSTKPKLDLKDRVIVVTGGAKGIGKVYSTRLAEAGARVVIADIDGEANETLAKAINGAGGQALPRATDVSSPESTQAMADAAAKAFGRIDGLVNNASLMSVLARRSWFEIPVEEWDRVMAVNLRGIFLCCRAVYPQMKKQGGGKIINISSSRVWEGTPNRLHYTTSKAGVVGLTRALAREVGDDNITVNSISPGFTLSETQVANSSNAYVANKAMALANKSLKRDQVPDDLVGALLFLLSDMSNYITGQTINIDGGHMMH
ncbi:MAG TPA: glucose 1-dehydrogenase [Alphaproteobacteria bacterium]|jgi:3-oxoacyl-[acyl-carrier protein] reductase|nr:glucose 1-dehydrogenase [Alphaproteobacteria bacterium]